MPQAQPQKVVDPTMVDSEHYSVEAEDEQVRILRIRYGAKGKSVMHYHPKSIAIPLTDARCRFAYPDGRTEDHDLRAGTPMIVPAGEHLPENLSDQPFEALLIELKG
jgi:uncharacterized RmlC-like cupin family protein